MDDEPIPMPNKDEARHLRIEIAKYIAHRWTIRKPEIVIRFALPDGWYEKLIQCRLFIDNCRGLSLTAAGQKVVKKWAQQNSNLQPPACRAGALTD